VTLHATIVAKTPIAGRVKTRLCPPCTPDEAAAIATAGILDTVDAIDGIAGIGDTARALLLDGPARPWMPAHYALVPQRGDGLGERLRNGFADLGAGVVIGMETPHAAHHVASALTAIRSGRDVLGLAEDGGYWLIGLSEATLRRLDEVFTGVPMSTSRTGAAQLRRLTAVGARPPVMLPTVRDLDTFDDLLAVAGSSRRGRLATLARRTVAAGRIEVADR
jgi:glycosyltransferase A (GT-A) superfamily protein (DUF2064 family)